MSVSVHCEGRCVIESVQCEAEVCQWECSVRGLGV